MRQTQTGFDAVRVDLERAPIHFQSFVETCKNGMDVAEPLVHDIERYFSVQPGHGPERFDRVGHSSGSSVKIAELVAHALGPGDRVNSGEQGGLGLGGQSRGREDTREGQIQPRIGGSDANGNLVLFDRRVELPIAEVGEPQQPAGFDITPIEVHRGLQVGYCA